MFLHWDYMKIFVALFSLALSIQLHHGSAWAKVTVAEAQEEVEAEEEVETDDFTLAVKRPPPVIKKWKAAFGLGLNGVAYSQTLPQRAILKHNDVSFPSIHAKVQYRWSRTWSTFFSYKRGSSNYTQTESARVSVDKYDWSAMNLETLWTLSKPRSHWMWGLRGGLSYTLLPFIHVDSTGDLIHKGNTITTAGVGAWALKQLGNFTIDISARYQMPVSAKAEGGEQITLKSPMFYEYGMTVSYPVRNVRLGLLLLGQTYQYDFSYNDNIIESVGSADFSIYNIQIFTSFQF